MKSFLNYSKLAIATLITSSVFIACSDEITENSVDIPYAANVGNIRSAGEAVDLGLASGTKWASKNIGATSESDNGILFVWGDVTGTLLNPTSTTTYTDVVEATSLSALFDMYKSTEQKVGYICDTTNIAKINEPKLIDLTFIGDTTKLDSLAKANIDTQKKEKINSFVKAKLDLMKEAHPGFLEATLTNEKFVLIMDWDGSKFVERIPSQKTERDTLDYYKKFEYASSSDLVINKIGSTEVKYFESPLASSYSEVKDEFDVVMRKDYIGGDISDVPVYSIIADAKYDAATANWGEGWKMPTTEQIRELIDSCKWEFTGTGYRVSSKVNNNSIFLPAAGYRYGDKWYGNGNAGYYATGEIFGIYHFPSMAEQANDGKGAINGNEDMPNMLIFQHGKFDNSINIYSNLSTSYGFSIRPVAK